MPLTYKKIPESDKEHVLKLIDIVLSGLPNPEFFIPYEQWELDSLFDAEHYAHLYGAYDICGGGNKLVGMSQLYVSAELYTLPSGTSGQPDFKQNFNINGPRVCEFGGNLVLPEYRRMGITTNLGQRSINLAKKLKYDYVVATVHVDNAPGHKVAEKLKLNLVGQKNLSNGFPCMVYQKKLR